MAEGYKTNRRISLLQ